MEVLDEKIIQILDSTFYQYVNDLRARLIKG